MHPDGGEADAFEQCKGGAERLGQLEFWREIVGGLALLDLRLDLVRVSLGVGLRLRLRVRVRLRLRVRVRVSPA